MSMNWSKINAAKKIWKNGFEEANAGFSRPTWQPKHSSPRRKMPSEYAIKRQTRHSSQSRRSKRNYMVVGNLGPCCPRCRRPTQIREPVEHRTDGKAYFTRWFYCTNQSCGVTTHFLPEYKVSSESEYAEAEAADPIACREAGKNAYEKVIEEVRAYSGPCPWD